MNNEYYEIEEILSNGFKNGHATRKELNLLAKHYYWVEKLSKEKVYSALVIFCYEHDSGFNEIIMRKALKSAVNYALTHPILVPKDVVIYQWELDRISEYKDFRVQKVLFSILVRAKAFGSKNTISELEIPIALKESRTKMSFSEFKKISHSLIDYLEYKSPHKGRFYYIKYSGSHDTKWVFQFSDKIPDNTSENFKKYIGGELYWCDKCGKPGIKNSNRQRVCEECRILADKEKKRKYWHKNKN